MVKESGLIRVLLLETGSTALEEFLELIGEKVKMKGFNKYRAQLDNKSESRECYCSTDSIVHMLLGTVVHGYVLYDVCGRGGVGLPAFIDS